jgi:energy-coupling factor transporter transmembrane protein EcfT
MKGHLSSPDNKVQREVEAQLWATERRKAVNFCISAAVLLAIAYLTPWKWQISILAFALGIMSLREAVKEPSLAIKAPPLLLIGLSAWLFWTTFSDQQLSSLTPKLSQLPVLRQESKPAVSAHTKPAKAVRLGYLQGTSRKPIATIFYRGSKKSGRADCSPYSKVISLPPGHYRVRIEGIRQAIITRERNVLIQPGRLTSIGPDK